MKIPNQSRINTLKSKTNKISGKAKPRLSKRTRLYGTNGQAKTGKSQLVPVGNQAPWTIGGPPLGGKANSKANLPRKTRRVVKNKAPKKRVPIVGNTNNAGMWGM